MTSRLTKEQAAVIGEDEAMDLAAGMGDELGLRLGLGELREEVRRAGQRAGLDHVEVRCLLHELSAWLGRAAARKPWRAGGRVHFGSRLAAAGREGGGAFPADVPSSRPVRRRIPRGVR